MSTPATIPILSKVFHHRANPPRHPVHPHRYYLTNTRQEKLPLVEEAIALSSRHDIHTDPEPMPGTPPGVNLDQFSIWVKTDCDCSDFWQVYRSLEQDPRWRVYLTLSEQ